MGFPDSPRGVAVFTDRDVEALRLAAERLRPGDDVRLFMRQARAIGAVMARLGAIDADLIATRSTRCAPRDWTTKRSPRP